LKVKKLPDSHFDSTQINKEPGLQLQSAKGAESKRVAVPQSFRFFWQLENEPCPDPKTVPICPENQEIFLS